MKGCQIEICSLFLAKKGKFATKLSKYLFSSENMKFSLCEEEVLQARKTCIAQSVVLLLESPFCRKPDTFSSVGSSKSSFSRLASVPSPTSRSPKTISPTLRVRDVCLCVCFFFFFFFFFLLFSLFALFAWLLWPVHTLLNASANRSPHFDSSFRLLVFVVSNFFFFFFLFSFGFVSEPNCEASNGGQHQHPCHAADVSERVRRSDARNVRAAQPVGSVRKKKKKKKKKKKPFF